eukprot:766858-Hanusia_phi.AAC.4
MALRHAQTARTRLWRMRHMAVKTFMLTRYTLNMVILNDAKLTPKVLLVLHKMTYQSKTMSSSKTKSSSWHYLSSQAREDYSASLRSNKVKATCQIAQRKMFIKHRGQLLECNNLLACRSSLANAMLAVLVNSSGA